MTKKCSDLKRNCALNDYVRKRKCHQINDRYHINGHVWKQKCCRLKDIYQSNEIIREQKCEKVYNRYQLNESSIRLLIRMVLMFSINENFWSKNNTLKFICKPKQKNFKNDFPI